MAGESDNKAKRKRYAKELGQRIAKAAEEAEGKKALGKKAGLTEDQVHKYVRGENIPSVDKLVAIANATGRSIEWLATGRTVPLTPAEPIPPGPVVSVVDGVRRLRETTHAFAYSAIRRALKFSQKTTEWLADEANIEVQKVDKFVGGYKKSNLLNACSYSDMASVLIKLDDLPTEIEFELNRLIYENDLTYLQLPKTYSELNGRQRAEDSIAFEEGWLEALATDLCPMEISELVIIEMPDESMWPTFAIGDLLIINQGCSRYIGTGIYLLKSGDHLMVRRISQIRSGNYLILRETKHLFEQEEFTPEEFKEVTFLGRVIWAGKKC